MISGRLIALVGVLLGVLAAGAPAQISPITGQSAPVVVCFAPRTSPDYVERVSTLTDLQNQLFYHNDYYIGGRWPGVQGTPKSLTWSFVPDGLVISAGTTGTGETNSPSTLFATMDSAFAGQGGRATWISRIQACFDRWHQVAGVTFTRVTSGGNDWDDGAGWGADGAPGLRGDIRISMHNIDGGSNILAYTYYPNSGDMVIDSSDIGSFGSSSNLNRFLRDCVTHELGHAMGLNHVCSSNTNQLMEPFINTVFDGPMQDDIRGMQRNYGDPFESNDTSATASTMGTLNLGGLLSVGAIPSPISGSNDPSASLCSIDGAGKVDWYVFSVTTPTSTNFTLTPIGTTYDDSTQAANGSCNSGTNTNALAQADLAMGVYASNGTTLIASATATGAGFAETLTNVPLGIGPYFVKVYATNSPAQTQSYRLSITSTCALASITQDPAGTTLVYDGETITLSAAASGATSVHWRKDNADLVDDARISGSSTNNLQILSATFTDAGSYQFTATNGCGVALSNAVAVGVNCYVNCDGGNVPPVVNVADFSCFLVKYAAGDPYANCDKSTTPPVLNVSDFTCFLQRYAIGCP